MVSWMQKGFSKAQEKLDMNRFVPKNNDLWDDTDGKADLKSSIYIETPDGKRISPDVTSPMPLWSAIPPNSKLKYEVQTLSDGKGKSDKFFLQIGYTNYPMMMNEYQQVLKSLDETQMAALEAGSPQMQDTVSKMTAQRILEKNLPVSVNIVNKTIVTDSDGMATGEIPMDNWPQSDYNIIIHYGYRHDAESATNWSKAWSNIGELGEAIAWLIIGVGVGVATGGLGWAAWIAVNTAAVAAEVAIGVYAVMTEKYGEATYNKHEALFPIWGYSHPYSFGWYGELPEETKQQSLTDLISDENMSIMEKAEVALLTNKMVQYGVGGFILLILLAAMKKRRDSQ